MAIGVLMRRRVQSVPLCLRTGLRQSSLLKPRHQQSLDRARRPVFQQVAKRNLHYESLWIPPAIFTCLFLALWTWKCVMLVLFQNTIIYNPFLPPNARSMTIADFARQCGGIKWTAQRIRSLDGTELALCVAEAASGVDDSRSEGKPIPVYIMYFQGNASSLPPRLPDLSWVLRRLQTAEPQATYTMVCLSYRGYWTSHDRPSEKGINKDAEAAFEWIARLHKSRSPDQQQPDPVVILWGQSIGCGFATNLTASRQFCSNFHIQALVLETPFTSTRDMLAALYPQKWLPYQYLWPFLRNHLDSLANLSKVAETDKGKSHLPKLYLIQAGKDELVPADHTPRLYERCREVGLPVERHRVGGALHNEVMVRSEGKAAIVRSIQSAVCSAQRSDSNNEESHAKPGTKHGPG